MASERNIVVPATEKVYNRIYTGILNFSFVLVIFFATTNTLVEFPIDKAIIFLLSVMIAFIKPEYPLMNLKEFSIIIIWIAIAMTSSLVNLTIVPMIYFPILGLIFALILRRHPKLILHSLYHALMINIIFGLLFDALALAGLTDEHVSPVVKGFTFLYSPRGFTATVQTYGTLCITWLLLYQLRKELGMINHIDKIFFVINTVAILASFNRSTLIFWMFILFFKHRKLFFTIIFFLGILMIKLWGEIITFMTSASSLVARSQLLQGFDLSFVKSHSVLVYLFGRGSNQYPPEVVARVRWFNRSDIENGYAMLLHSYGSLGLLVYIILCFSFIFQFIKIRRWAEAIILFFYFFLTQYFTQEFVSVTFDLFLAVMFFTYDIYSRQVKIDKAAPAGFL